ncbi:MAG: nitroreductase [Peptococcaceae bacterium]|jgi:nitroreductase/NAD-dependent dihydropyrimidine dehydrogenase PreA subunit|nr:nitroreductase [Peptococcaceae bacterium]
MMIVDIKKCTGCRKCVADCFPRDIEIINHKAKIRNISCIKCGHCIAVCPANAVYSSEYDMSEVKNYNQEDFTIEADKLLNFIKFRRSIRQFKDQDVENEKLLKIIEAGRFTPTGSNLQDVSYIIVKKRLPELRVKILSTLKQMGESYLSASNTQHEAQQALYKRYAEKWISMHDEYQANPEANDRLFFNAPAIIVVTAQAAISGGLASSSMELMANALGLGVLFSGYFVRAARANKEILEFLGVKEGKDIISCLVIGYPNVRYLRTVPRKKADVSWK